MIWCSYFVFHLSVSNMDVFVGAPLFMDRGSDGKLREVGQVGTHRASVAYVHTYILIL